MGQYHRPYNLDKKQTIDPHKLGCGLKLLEQHGEGGVCSALHVLLAACSGRGGGDYQSEDEIVGSWAGDRIAIIGDYAEPDDIPGCNAQEVYNSQDYEDITDKLIPILERELELIYCGDGWCNRVSVWDIKGFQTSHGRGDRIYEISGKHYLASHVREKLSEYMERTFRADRELTVENIGLVPMTEQQYREAGY